MDRTLSFQNNLNVIWLERGDFKFSIGSLNNKFPCMVLELLRILQSALCVESRSQHGREHKRSNAKNYEPKLEEKDK